VLMLLGTDATDQSTTRRSVVARSAAGLGLFVVVTLGAWRALQGYARGAIGKYEAIPDDFGSVKGVGQQLFGDALLPFELATALLIVAVVGAIAVARSGGKASVKKLQQDPSAHRFFAGPVEQPEPTRPIAKEPTQ
jgi:NADH-quinone oxidoreductase subunit J